jgi:hypothetical protein
MSNNLILVDPLKENEFRVWYGANNKWVYKNFAGAVETSQKKTDKIQKCTYECPRGLKLCHKDNLCYKQGCPGRGSREYGKKPQEKCPQVQSPANVVSIPNDGETTNEGGVVGGFVKCNNNTFGDPLPGVVKKCIVGKSPPNGQQAVVKETFMESFSETVTQNWIIILIVFVIAAFICIFGLIFADTNNFKNGFRNMMPPFNRSS